MGSSVISAPLDPAAMLEAIKTVDGAGSGLDADTVGGFQAYKFNTISSYMRTGPHWGKVNGVASSAGWFFDNQAGAYGFAANDPVFPLDESGFVNWSYEAERAFFYVAKNSDTIRMNGRELARQDEIQQLTATGSAGAVGALAFAWVGDVELSYGDTVAGSQLVPAQLIGGGSQAGGRNGSYYLTGIGVCIAFERDNPFSGVWRCLGSTQYPTTGAWTGATLFQRVA